MWWSSWFGNDGVRFHWVWKVVNKPLSSPVRKKRFWKKSYMIV